MKGQLGIETMIALTISLFFLVIMTTFYLAKNEDINFLKKYFEARRVCFDVKSVIDEVYSSGNGSLILFSVPNFLEGSNYSLSIDSESRTIRVEWDSYLVSCPILANVSNFTHNFFYLSKGNNFGYNHEGVVFIKKV